MSLVIGLKSAGHFDELLAVLEQLAAEPDQ
jgi:hypothetical protein